jgi:diguanylate cyclase (GGDEF)-like protein
LLFPGAKRFPTAEEQAAIESAVPLARIALTTDASRAAVDRADRLDPLTGVLVRRAFLAELESVGRRARDTIGLLLVAIDDLGAVNEHFGRDTGDDLLYTVGRRLAGIVRGRDLVGRASANRFAIACITAADNEPLERFAARVREVMAQPYQHDGRPVPIVVRVAVASHRGRLGEPIALLADAERALRALRAGASGRPGPDGRPSVFDSGRPDRTERRQRHSGSAASDR